MADPRLLSITLDGETLPVARPELADEQRVAMADLVAHNRFEPCRAAARGHGGPYRVRLAVADGRLAIAVHDLDDRPLETVLLGMTRFRRPLRDYLAIRDSYLNATTNGTAQQVEPIDMARRALHDAAATTLMDALEHKIAMDMATARRLWTLIAALRFRG